MGDILPRLIALAMGCFFVVYGALLSWNPRAWLKFHDTFVDRSRSRLVAWRNWNPHGTDAKVFGAGCVLVGLFIVYSALFHA